MENKSKRSILDRFKRSISLKTVAIIFAVFILFSFLTSFILFKIEEKKAIEELNKEGRLILKRLVYILRDPLWNFDKNEIENLMKIEMDNEIVFAIILKNDRKQIFKAYIKHNGQLKEISDEEVVLIRNSLIYYSDLIEKNKKNIGSVELYITKEKLFKDLRILVFNIFIEIMSISFVLIILIILIIRKLVLKPLIDINSSLLSFSDRNFDVRINVKSEDEIGNIATNFNIMAEKIKAYSSNLEAMVEERTIELNQANEELLRANRMMMNELKIARKIQDSLIPKIFPMDETVDVKGKYIPMEIMGGDYYDVFRVNEDKLALVIADVSGHGVPAALITTMAKVSFNLHSQNCSSVSEIISNVNKDIYSAIKDSEVPIFLTAFYGEVDLKNRVLRYVNAGHNEIYVLRHNRNMLEILPSSSIVIGVFEDSNFVEKEINIYENDKIILYTDGIPESRNINNDFYGWDRLKEVILENKDYSVKVMIENIIKDVNNFVRDAPIHDDMTLLIAELLPNNDGIIFDVDYAVGIEPRTITKEQINYEKYLKIKEEFEKAVDLFDHCKYIEASQILEDIIKEKEPEINLFKVYNLLGYIYYKLGNNDKCIYYWNIAKSLYPDNKNLSRNYEIVSKKIKNIKI